MAVLGSDSDSFVTHFNLALVHQFFTEQCGESEKEGFLCRLQFSLQCISAIMHKSGSYNELTDSPTGWL